MGSIQEPLNARLYPRVAQMQAKLAKEHLVCLTYPGGQYADHLTLPDGTGLTSAKLTWDLLKRLDMLETLRILLSDGCGVVSFNSLKST